MYRKHLRLVVRTFALSCMFVTALLFPPVQQVLAAEGGGGETGGPVSVENRSHEATAKKWPPDPDPDAAGRRIYQWINSYILNHMEEEDIETVNEFCAFGLSDDGGYGCAEGPFRHMNNMYVAWGPEEPPDPYHVEFEVPIYFVYFDTGIGELVIASYGTVAYVFDQPTGTVQQVMTLTEDGVTRVLNTTLEVDPNNVAHVDGTLTVTDEFRNTETYEGGWTSSDGGENWNLNEDSDPGFEEGAEDMGDDACPYPRVCDPVTILVIVVVVVIVFVACWIFCWMFWWLDNWHIRDWFQQKLRNLNPTHPFSPFGQPDLVLA
jgi:hypothetical protein